MGKGDEARKKARDRIRRLREMTASRGCTEAEALSAAEKAAQIMREHGISEAEVEIDAQRSARRAGRGKSVRANLWPIIAACTNTVPAITEEGVVFVGREPGPDIAVYLRDISERALDSEIRKFKRTTFYRRRRGLASKRAAVSGFADGMVSRLGTRLWEIFGPQHDESAVDEAIEARREMFGSGRAVTAPTGSLRHYEARAAGWRAGARVNLSHGVGGTSASPLQLGSSR